MTTIGTLDETLDATASGTVGGMPQSSVATSEEGYEPASDRSTTTVSPVSRSVPSQQARKSMRVLLRSCFDSLGRILDNQDDFILKANSFTQFQAYLGDLWGLRSNFGDAFAEIINMLQGLVLGREETCFSQPEVAALQYAMLRLQNTHVIDDRVANEITSDLIKGGLDVFRELD